jgi:hypothetical protein
MRHRRRERDTQKERKGAKGENKRFLTIGGWGGGGLRWLTERGISDRG